MGKNSFILRCDVIDRFARYSNEEFGKLIKAISNYVKYGEIPELDDNLMIAFDFIRVDIDADMEKYEKTCQKNKENIMKRWEEEKKKNK